ncbi:hypothetical protein ACFU7T_36040 [Streptomyces sp. NPDC057555]|uniref:hypothetical protein n=1 Tax=Streptomyces sp. NPDC057555 TaxID=3346166 RepID=UPI0036ACBD66
MPSALQAAVGTAPHAPVRPQAGEAAITVVLPADFTAFCQLHHDAYQHYAHHLVADPALANLAVQHALGDIVASWTEALAGHHTRAVAWASLTRRVHRAAHHPSSRIHPTPAVGLFRLVPAEQADTALLHHLLGLDITSTADTLGIERATAVSRLHAFGRRLNHPAASALRICWQEVASRRTRCQNPGERR